VCSPNVQLDDGVLLQFAEPPVEIRMQHYAFLVDEDLFDRAYRRLCAGGTEHWADRRCAAQAKSTPSTVAGGLLQGPRWSRDRAAHPRVPVAEGILVWRPARGVRPGTPVSEASTGCRPATGLGVGMPIPTDTGPGEHMFDQTATVEAADHAGPRPTFGQHDTH
jgi:hypothetical protein